MGGGTSKQVEVATKTKPKHKSSILVTKTRQAHTGIEHASEAEEATKKKLEHQLAQAMANRTSDTIEESSEVAEEAAVSVVALSSHGEAPLSPTGNGSKSTRRGSVPASSALIQGEAHQAMQQEASQGESIIASGPGDTDSAS
mmetsp:Transcript_30326/g.61773  ORF Transcript_30326/g.61773 Transcript_30326/m.61773 type:complete len:143 (-) Transcript_30326:278-706(-)|eukprot:CAMPEP_0171610084 /NCGR_PEP_ID=MMETSP0990-20121206/9843_1 /TAXON_ID=483369 /ORGANISM="non described non described, Strain CCMP2098" /LENGTH=142 /DNA_ID=CAMNT_0012173435 /DNA_START=80 /DNA_END=508 /DNA_ORIENTATION=+